MSIRSLLVLAHVILQAIFSTHLWHMFREDLLAEEAGVNGESWEEQVQLFCACVEKARHRRDPAATVGESHSCQVDVL